MKRFWISWYQTTEDYRPLQDPPEPENIKAWWCSGESEAGSILCAVVDAENQETAKEAINTAFAASDTDISGFRFIEEKTPDFVPNDRFPITKQWEKERLGIGKTSEEKHNDFLLNFIRNSEDVSQMSDGELIDACLDAFSDLEIGSRKEALVQEILTRFQKAICLDETPNGITADGEPVWADEVSDGD